MNPKLTALLAILILGGIVLNAATFTVDEAEQAVVLQFQRPVGDVITRPGLHFKLPFIQNVVRFDERLFSWDGDPNQIPTRGEQFISVDTTARWRISDPVLFFQRVRDERGAHLRLSDILDSVVRDEISSTELVEIVRSKDWNISAEDLERVTVGGDDDTEILLQEVTRGREELVASILLKAQRQVPDLGIELIDIRIKRLGYVQDVQERVFDRMKAERQRIAEQFRSEGLGRAASIDGDTQEQLSAIRSGAMRDAEIIRGRADAEAARIYNEAFGSDPEFYAYFRTLESYRGTLGAGMTLVIGADTEYFRYLRSTVADRPEP